MDGECTHKWMGLQRYSDPALVWVKRDNNAWHNGKNLAPNNQPTIVQTNDGQFRWNIWMSPVFNMILLYHCSLNIAP